MTHHNSIPLSHLPNIVKLWISVNSISQLNSISELSTLIKSNSLTSSSSYLYNKNLVKKNTKDISLGSWKYRKYSLSNVLFSIAQESTWKEDGKDVERLLITLTYQLWDMGFPKEEESFSIFCVCLYTSNKKFSLHFDTCKLKNKNEKVTNSDKPCLITLSR